MKQLSIAALFTFALLFVGCGQGDKLKDTATMNDGKQIWTLMRMAVSGNKPYRDVLKAEGYLEKFDNEWTLLVKPEEYKSLSIDTVVMICKRKSHDGKEMVVYRDARVMPR